MLLHGQPTPGLGDNPAVNVVGTRPEHLLWAVERSATLLTAHECAQIVELIRPGGR